MIRFIDCRRSSASKFGGILRLLAAQISLLKILRSYRKRSRPNLAFGRARLHIFAAAGSTIKFLAVKFYRVKFGFEEFQILRLKFHGAEFSMHPQNARFAKRTEIAKF